MAGPSGSAGGGGAEGRRVHGRLGVGAHVVDLVTGLPQVLGHQGLEPEAGVV